MSDNVRRNNLFGLEESLCELKHRIRFVWDAVTAMSSEPGNIDSETTEGLRVILTDILDLSVLIEKEYKQMVKHEVKT